MTVKSDTLGIAIPTYRSVCAERAVDAPRDANPAPHRLAGSLSQVGA